MKIRTHILFVIFGMTLLITSCGGGDTSSQKIVFMENGTVFESFEMKQDYDKRMEKEMKKESLFLDSLGVILNSGSITDSLKIYQLRKEYYVSEEIFNKKVEQLSTQYTTEVNDRLNSYIKEYAEEKGYDIILGSGGSGNIMHVREEDNVTQDLIKYINKKYTK